MSEGMNEKIKMFTDVFLEKNGFSLLREESFKEHFGNEIYEFKNNAKCHIRLMRDKGLWSIEIGTYKDNKPFWFSLSLLFSYLGLGEKMIPRMSSEIPAKDEADFIFLKELELVQKHSKELFYCFDTTNENTVEELQDLSRERMKKEFPGLF